MAVKKAPVKKTTVKKSSASPRPSAARTHAPQEGRKNAAGMISWFMVPDMTQSKGRWMLRALFWTIGFAIFVFTFGALGLQSNFAEAGLASPTFPQAIRMMGYMAIARPLSLILPMLLAYILGLFIFMPRKLLDRASMVAISWTLTLWTMIASGIVLGLMAFETKIGAFAIPLYIIMLGGIIGVFAAIVAFARYLKIPKLAIFLTFPFGAMLFEYSAYFLPFKDADRSIAIKYNWYRRFVDFLLGTRNGQLVLALVVLLSAALMPSPWEIFMILFFFPIYFWKGGAWMIKNMKPISWIVAFLNTAFIAYIVYFVKSAETAMMLMGY